MNQTANDAIRAAVRETYSQIAASGSDVGCSPSACDCGPSPHTQLDSTQLGYSETELTAVPAGYNLGLGCVNSGAIAALKPG